MKYGDAVGYPRLHASTSSPFEDHDNGFGEPARFHSSTNSFNEGAGCSWSIPPPAVRPRPHHVCSIDEKHYFSIAGQAVGAGTCDRRDLRSRIMRDSSATTTTTTTAATMPTTSRRE
jgi:hypothetical protein